MEHTPTYRTPHRARRPGFSLAELMIALGIMGIGLVMAAALFPAAIKQHRRSSRDVLGMIICQNGVAIARKTLTHPLKDKAGASVGTEIADCTSTIPEASRGYPIDEANPRRGFLLMARRKSDTAGHENDYVLAVIAYALSDPDHVAEIRKLAGVVLNDLDTKVPLGSIAADEQTKLIGSPVIAPNGAFAYIAGVDGGEGVLHRAWDSGSTTDVYVVVEAVGLGGQIVGACSPAMTVFETRTAFP